MEVLSRCLQRHARRRPHRLKNYMHAWGTLSQSQSNLRYTEYTETYRSP